MESKPATRCHHIDVRGIQCDSPALGKTRLCYYHVQGRSTATKYYSEAPYAAVEGDLPLFENAHSIQIAIRQVASLLIQGKIEHKAANSLLYSLQLATYNLKQMQAEKPHPAQVVVELDKVEETLPESAFAQPAPPETDSEPGRKRTQSESSRKKDNQPTPEEIQEQVDYLVFLGKHLDDPVGEFPNEQEFIRLDRALREGALGDVDRIMRETPKDEIEEKLRGRTKRKSSDSLPPGTIQACAGRARHVN